MLESRQILLFSVTFALCMYTFFSINIWTPESHLKRRGNTPTKAILQCSQMISPISSSFSNLKSFSFITIIMLTHHNWWSTHYECYAALCQNWGWSASTTSILTNREVRDPLQKKQLFQGEKLKKTSPNFFCGLPIHTKNTFCKKIGSKRSFQPSAVVGAIYRGLYGVATAN